MRITSIVLKTVFFHDENYNYKPSAQQYDYLFAWFPEIFTDGEKKIKKNWRRLLHGKNITKKSLMCQTKRNKT